MESLGVMRSQLEYQAHEAKNAAADFRRNWQRDMDDVIYCILVFLNQA